MSRTLFLLLLIGCVGSVAIADETTHPPRTLGESTMQRWKVNRDELGERKYRVFLVRQRKFDERLANQMLASAMQSPDSVQLMQLEQILLNAYAGPAAEKAAMIVAARHLNHRGMGVLCHQLSYSLKSAPAGEYVLRAVVSNSTSNDDIAVATVALARRLRMKVDEAITIKTLAFRRTTALAEYGRKYVQELLQLDTDAARAEAKALLQKANSYSGELVLLDGQANIGELAGKEIVSLSTQTIGQQAPDIVGVDVHGQHLRLKDSDGKVRVLLFLGHWCHSCQGSYPTYRRLVQEHADQPFAMLAVNSDTEKSKLQELIDLDEVTWPCWWDAEKDPMPIHEQWKLTGAPHLFVLDRDRVIRFSGLYGKELEDAVKQLLKEDWK